ncbi:MAG: lamin tail domain-containing protein [Sandaracinaceae bacterium]|nr:lamin tail domain-containing protein [Sandaracinaceae bacterium]
MTYMQRQALIALVLFSTTACADKTALLIEVTSSDLRVPDDIDGLRFEVSATTGQMVDRTFPIRAAWPHSLTVLPAGSVQSTEVTVTVTGLKDGSPRVRRVIPARFDAGLTRRVMVVFSSDCLGVECPEGVDCVRGECTNAQNDGGIDAGLDASTPLDSGGADSGSDAGRDGGSDAGSIDSGIDGGSRDAGSPDIRCDSADTTVCRGVLVISELAVAGSGGGSDEFIEIYNRSTQVVDASNVTVGYAATSTSTPGTRVTVPNGTILPAGGFYFAASAGYVAVPGSPMPDTNASGPWSSAQGFAGNRGALVMAVRGTILDIVGWQRAGETSIPMSEGIPTLGMSDAAANGGASYERKALTDSTPATMGPGGRDERAGNGFDSENNGADFVQRSTRQPQSTSSMTEQ